MRNRLLSGRIVHPSATTPEYELIVEHTMSSWFGLRQIICIQTYRGNIAWRRYPQGDDVDNDTAKWLSQQTQQSEWTQEAPPSLQTETDLFNALGESLIRLSVGSCSCGTKSPEISFHASDCRYRISASALETLGTLRNTVLSLSHSAS